MVARQQAAIISPYCVASIHQRQCVKCRFVDKNQGIQVTVPGAYKLCGTYGRNGGNYNGYHNLIENTELTGTINFGGLT